MILPFLMVKSCSIYMFNRHSVLPKTWRCPSSKAIPKNTRYMGGIKLRQWEFYCVVGVPYYTQCVYIYKYILYLTFIQDSFVFRIYFSMFLMIYVHNMIIYIYTCIYDISISWSIFDSPQKKGSFAGDGYVPWQKTRWDQFLAIQQAGDVVDKIKRTWKKYGK